MKNILDKLKDVLIEYTVFLNYLPDSPDNIICLFEYANVPVHSFHKMENMYNVQVRVRDETSAKAFATVTAVANKLNRYSDFEIDVLQSSTILDIGKDNNNPQRHEYTVNLKIYEKG